MNKSSIYPPHFNKITYVLFLSLFSFLNSYSQTPFVVDNSSTDAQQTIEDQTGNVGIGILDVQANLHISSFGNEALDPTNGTVSTVATVKSAFRIDNRFSTKKINSNGGPDNQVVFVPLDYSVIVNRVNVTNFTNPSTITDFVINNQGLTGIGTAAPKATLDVQGFVRIGNVSVPNPMVTKGYSLYVQYGVLAESFKCALDGSTEWSDYVFDPNYKLPEFSYVENYIKTNKHLPDVPNAEDVSCNGIDLGKMDAILLRKIEELTLYILELKKENLEMKSQISYITK